MLFMHTWQAVIEGRKTMTRRIVKPGEIMVALGSVHINERLKWYVGQSIAVQPGRGQKAVARIQITGIRRQDVREIDYDDVRAEGFDSAADFWLTWIKMHDPKAESPTAWYLNTRPAAHYDAWVLEFELVEDAR